MHIFGEFENQAEGRYNNKTNKGVGSYNYKKVDVSNFTVKS